MRHFASAFLMAPLFAAAAFAAAPASPAASGPTADLADPALNPPPIAVDFKNASAADVAASLSKSLGTKIDVSPGANASFTLTAADQPLWKVFLDLSAQHGLSFQDSMGQLRLTTSGETWRRATIVGPVAIFPQTLTRQRTASLQNDPGKEFAPETLSLTCKIAVDPRVHVVSMANPAFTRITDNTGAVLYQDSGRPDRLQAVASAGIRSVTASMPVGDKKATRIASAGGRVHFMVATAEDTLEIADPQTKTGQKFTLADRTISLDRFSVSTNAADISLNYALGTPILSPASGATEPPAPAVSILDADGTIIQTGTLRGGYSGFLAGAYKPPFKIRLSLPSKTREVTIPFELQDLPLP